ncbi:sigma-54 interaction domain-containing protein [Phosphitispora fastidiosa]|uniref:sigma-54 interaction domain-containing protein n=1 Tax=Phosphitispora fastidiosa TaxID=2837202 RepID=UPI001E3C73DC|nr:sigma 54-interacting transcriptional regulator [Phosphitispora fastidiosa]MBU7005201.1 PAS domain S-box-containing protein [Phosphitispora fastidiosa]
MTGKKSPQKSVPEIQNELDQETFQKILDNSYDEIFVTDKNGITIYVNNACERNYGVTASQLLGQQPGQMAAEGYCFPPITPLILSEKKIITLEQKTITGKRIVTTATPVFDQNGELELIVQNVRDISQIGEIKHDLQDTLKLVERYKHEVQELRKKEFQISNLVVRSKQMEELLELVHKVARVDANILILGESGTGKGVLAKYIHNLSSRREGPFMTINCAAIPDQLLESELFGYVPGAFTGAEKKGKTGLFELADGGTLFLDEIGEIPLRLQAKLLHVIQERSFCRVGSTEPIKLDCRILAATNRDLNKMVHEGGFREDLYYRLNVIEIEMPPLRARTEDIPHLIYFFINKFDKECHTTHQLSHEALEILVHYPWPGNIRELENMVERLIITVTESVIEPKHLPRQLRDNFESQEISGTDFTSLDLALEMVEKKLITRAYEMLKSSYKVAKALNISQSKASRLIRKYGLEQG